MSRKRKPGVILGPDGRPYVAPPKQAAADADKPVTISITTHSGASADSIDMSRYLSHFLVSYDLDVGRGAPKAAKAEETLPVAVARQVDALTAGFDGAGHPELPQPKPDLHTYADALASALKNCKHETVTDTIHSRGEYFCEDCRKYLSRDDMKRRNAGSPWFRWFGG